MIELFPTIAILDQAIRKPLEMYATLSTLQGVVHLISTRDGSNNIEIEALNVNLTFEKFQSFHSDHMVNPKKLLSIQFMH